MLLGLALLKEWVCKFAGQSKMKGEGERQDAGIEKKFHLMLHLPRSVSTFRHGETAARERNEFTIG